MTHSQYFIRNDDVGARTPALERFVETFLAAGLPVSYQIIPERLTTECGRWLREHHAAYPNLIEFGQHGLRHEMMLGGKRVWREFGPERSYAVQLADIRTGKMIIEDKLGPVQLFTPPQHKYDRNTLHAIVAAGHTIFSAAHYPALPYRVAYAAGRALGWSSIRHHGVSRHGRMREDAPLYELSISVPVDNGGRVITHPKRILARSNAARRHTPIVGFMLHHEVYAATPNTLTEIAATLRGLNTTHFATLAALSCHVRVPDNRYSPQVLTNTMSSD